MNKYVVVLSHRNRIASLELSADEYSQRLVVKKNVDKMEYNGHMWTVISVMDYDAMVNQTDSKPF